MSLVSRVSDKKRSCSQSRLPLRCKIDVCNMSFHIDNRSEENCRRKLCRATSALAEQISINLQCKRKKIILCSGALRILGLIKELKAFKFEHAALALTSKGSLFWDTLYKTAPFEIEYNKLLKLGC